MNMDPETQPAVLQLRLVVEAADYDAAVRFYRDELGLVQEEAFEGDDGARGIILDAGRATLELNNSAQKAAIDQVEAGGTPSARIRVAFEVTDAAGKTRQLTETGATLIAAPTITPWQSLNSRLAAPDLEVTLFEELLPPDQRPGATSE
jgi:catechol 2,3-dioxygenase-like lactoylglutathione lyase family enzyme